MPEIISTDHLEVIRRRYCTGDYFEGGSICADDIRLLITSVDLLKKSMVELKTHYRLYKHIAKSVRGALDGEHTQRDILREFDSIVARAEAAEENNKRLTREIEIRKQDQKLYAPCPGHGGKAQGECLLCRAEKAEGKIEVIRNALKAARAALQRP